MSSKEGRELQLAITGILMLVFTIGGVWGVYSGLQQNAASAAAADWKAGEAEILSFSIDTSGEYETPAVSYRFDAAGRQWTGKDIYPGTPDPEIGTSTSDNFKSLFRPGSKVPVYFDPSDPRRSALLVPPPTWARREFMLGMFGLIGSIAIIVQFIKTLRSPITADSKS